MEGYCFVGISHKFTSLFLQTDKLRQEFTEDMSIQRAVSMVFERRPDFRFPLILISLHPLSFSNLLYKCGVVFTGWMDFVIRCCSGICAEWKVGLLLMLIPYH